MLWKYEFNTGIPLIDSQHKDLVTMINLLEQSIPRGDANKAIATVLKFLVNYTKIHFNDEEAVMRELDYPQLDWHVNLHKHLIRELADILMGLKSGKKVLGKEVFEFLRHWLTDHILKEDTKLKEPYAKKIGVSYGGRAMTQEKKREGQQAKIDLLESLHKEGLISEEAYRTKRLELLAEEG